MGIGTPHALVDHVVDGHATLETKRHPYPQENHDDTGVLTDRPVMLRAHTRVVQNLRDGRVFITSQNHGFAVDESSLPDNIEVTHKSLFDGSLQGIERTDKPAFGFQGHPEASPGPHDVAPLFDHFIELIEAHKT